MDAFTGEIRLMPYLNLLPEYWASCNGQLLAVSQYQALFTLIGTTYGGDGRTTFGVPNLNGRIPVGLGQSPQGSINWTLNEQLGANTATVNSAQTPNHNHDFNAKLPTQVPAGMSGGANAGATSMLGRAIGAGTPPKPIKMFDSPPAANPTTLDLQVAPAFGPNPAPSHPNLQPYLPLFYFICVSGNYPPPPQ